MVSPVFKDSTGNDIKPAKPLTYKLKAKPPSKEGNTDNICIANGKDGWSEDGCNSVKFASKVYSSVTLSDDESDESDENSSQCDCSVNTEITVVDDITSMFTNSNLDALSMILVSLSSAS